MRRKRKEDLTVGEDSFLDTTANLVGILIILVVVIGAKTKIEAEEYSQELAETDYTEQLEEPKREATALFASLRKQALEIQEYELENRYRKAERDQLLMQVKLAEEQLEERLSQLDSQRQQDIERERQLDRLQSELREVEQQLGAAEDTKRPEIILEHLPTPMAKTVFTREMHVQLEDNLVTLIPWDRLVEALKQQVPLAARRKSYKDGLEDRLGPIGGFLMRYRMSPVQGGLELDYFELETTPDAPAETLKEAFRSAGRLQLELATRNPAETVVTVWVRPDSFATFRELKSRLFEQGFLCAARPLPPDVRIGASPRGNRSSAQ